MCGSTSASAQPSWSCRPSRSWRRGPPRVTRECGAGAVRAPTGEVHIGGQHAEYTYYVDGVPVPSGVSGSLNELFDPAIVNTINFKTGGWDAEYGNKNA